MIQQTFINRLQRQCGIRVGAIGVLCLIGAVALASSVSRPAQPASLASSSGSRTLGATLFHEKGCEYCHGADGVGGDRGPNLSTVGKRLSKQQIEHQIQNGGKVMPPFRDVLQLDEFNSLVEYLSAKRKASKK